MNVIVSAKSSAVELAHLEELRERVFEKLGKLIDRNSIVRVTLDDMNGPKGGQDKVCTVQMWPKKSIPVVAKSIARSEDEAFRKSLKKFMGIIRRFK